MAARPGGIAPAKLEHLAVISEQLESNEGLRRSVFESIGGESIEVLGAATQVVNGINYFVKVKHGEGKFAHLRIYWDRATYSLSDSRTDQTADSVIEHF